MHKLLKYCLSLILIVSLVFKLPEIHYNYIRSYVGNNVVKIVNKEGNHGGTGFHVRGKSGRTYILTNSHVCSHIQENGLVNVADEFGNIIPRRVLLDSDYTDLCLVEAMPGASGLFLGSGPSPGEIVAVVGHPKLMPLTVTRGEIIAEAEVQVMDHIIQNSDDKCDKPKNKIVKVNVFVFELDVCTVKIKANLSNVTILPGNSGSPVVNFFGNVVGVAFAGDSDSNWGSFVTLSDIKEILKAF